MTSTTLQCLAITLVGGLALAGCRAIDTSPGSGRADPWASPVNDPQITVLPAELRPWLGFQPAVVTRNDVGALDVEVPVRNLAERQYLLDYRVLFLDAAGREMEPVMGWSMFPLGPKQVARLKANSFDARAEGYRVEVKWAR